MDSESTVMSLQHQIQQKEADLVALKQEVSMVFLYLSIMMLHGSEWSPSCCTAYLKRPLVPYFVPGSEPIIQPTACLFTGLILSSTLYLQEI
jgi:hypothetical protein